MKILFLSDIHGSVAALDAVLDFYDSHRYKMLVLLGDFLNYGPRNGLFDGLDPNTVAGRLSKYASQIVAVRGNCDSEVDQMLLNFPMQSTYSILAQNGIRFFLTHGHVYNEKQLPTAPSCDVFVYGHTHLPVLREANAEQGSPIILNPGSPTFPKGGNPPTFATFAYDTLAIRTLDGTAIEVLENISKKVADWKKAHTPDSIG